MKKLLCLGLIALFIASLILTSCGSSSTTPSSTEITVATYANVPPFESINKETNDIEGLDIDIMNAVAQKQGLAVIYKNKEWDPLISGMALGMYDAAISSIIITPEIKKDMLFSEPYFAAGQIVVVKKENTSITGKDNLTGLVGVQTGTNGETEVKKLKNVTAESYQEISAAILDLVRGKVQAVVCDNPVAIQYVAKNPDILKTAGDVFTDEDYVIAVAKGKTDLLKKINAGLQAIKAEGKIDQYSRKWLK